jgi:hypothetical protein
MRMKIGVLLFLVVGSFAARAQPAIHGRRLDSLFGGWPPPGIAFPGAGIRLQTSWVDVAPISLYQRDSLRIMWPDRMPCLAPLRVTDRMARRMRICCGVEKMPNALRP